MPLRTGPEQKQRIKDLFKIADVENANELDLSFFLGGSVKLGPHQVLGSVSVPMLWALVLDRL